ncbi:flagellar hook protein FlgE [Helicobacter sp. 12S02634-8]|uniref:flagellar hook-basal body complex protein n=1 Tax=Helicobacter sp. 12S02634-8 TaxID=1476199 RepID=UPI000BA7E15F|nr:flagellar hook-basal body complex protein [Helicobacter sp. 12S02634-8]PAF47311.1 flagellar hook protein FlgE [Helicobacter sp. 12S02634-8]
MNDTILNSYSGIKTHQFGLDSIANNIANINTTGYKENIPEFKSLFATHLDSLNASSITSNDRNFGASGASNAISNKDGNYHQSDGEFDMAYQGKGWFVVGPNKQGSFKIQEDGYEQTQPNYFTRNGSFGRDGDGYLVNSSGYYVYGINLGKIKNGVFTANNDTDKDIQELTSSTLTPLNIPQELKFQPVLTSKVDISINLNPKSGFKNAQDFFLDSEGELLQDRWDKQDINALADNNNEPLDTSLHKTITIAITKNKQTQNFEFTYGTQGTDHNEFTTIKDLQTLFKDKTGLDLEVAKDENGKPKTPLSLRITNNSEDMDLSLGGSLAKKLGLQGQDMPFKKGSYQDSNPIKIPAYSTSVEIYDKDGKKFLLQSDYFLTTTDNTNQTPPIHQKWEVQSAIYEPKDHDMLSKAPIWQTIEFDPDGKIIAQPITLDFKGNTLEYSLSKSKDYTSTNHPYQDSKLKEATQDGRPEGSLQEVRVDDNGIIYLAFSNGAIEPMGRVGIAAFINDQGLKKIGGNLFEMASSTINGENKLLSGNPLLGWNQEDGQLKFGKVMHKYLETSNVDVGDALTNLILMQRGYSMNAKAFSTGDELIKEAINLKK